MELVKTATTEPATDCATEPTNVGTQEMIGKVSTDSQSTTQPIADTESTKHIGGDWYEIIDPATGYPYYLHNSTGFSQWTWPEDIPYNSAKQTSTNSNMSQEELSSWGRDSRIIGHTAVTGNTQTLQNDISSLGRNQTKIMPIGNARNNNNSKQPSSVKANSKQPRKPREARPRAGCLAIWIVSLCPLLSVVYMYVLFDFLYECAKLPSYPCETGPFIGPGCVLVLCVIPICYSYSKLMIKIKSFNERIEKGEIVEDLSVQKGRKRFHVDTGELMCGQFFEDAGLADLADDIDAERKNETVSLETRIDRLVPEEEA